MMERKNQRTVAKREEEVPEEVACLRLAESVGGGHGFAVGVSRFCNDFSQRKGFGIAPKSVFCRDHGGPQIALLLNCVSEMCSDPTEEDKLVGCADCEETTESGMWIARPESDFVDQEGESVFLVR